MSSSSTESLNFYEDYDNGLAALSNMTNFSDIMDCPDYDQEALAMVDNFSFWVEGVSQTTVAIFGIIGNTVASIILSR